MIYTVIGFIIFWALILFISWVAVSLFWRWCIRSNNYLYQFFEAALAIRKFNLPKGEKIDPEVVSHLLDRVKNKKGVRYSKKILFRKLLIRQMDKILQEAVKQNNNQ